MGRRIRTGAPRGHVTVTEAEKAEKPRVRTRRLTWNAVPDQRETSGPPIATLDRLECLGEAAAAVCAETAVVVESRRQMFHVERRSYFVTGTDTGVGKTFVSCALATRARELDPTAKVFAFKPIETGCTSAFGEDQEALAVAAGNWQRGVLRGVYQFALPAAPLVAAEAEGRAIDMSIVLDEWKRGCEGARVAIVEGAGGWRVPITRTADMGTLAVEVGAPVIVVARATLGTINHSLLSIEAVERQGCTVAALVLSLRPDEDRAFAQSNADQIARCWRGRVILFDGDLAALDRLLGRSVDR